MCGKTIKLRDEYAGKKGKCPECKSVLTVPAAEAQLPAEPPPTPTPQHYEPAPQPVVVHATPLTHTVNTQVVVTPSKSVSGLGIAALVLGIISCLMCWIPFLGLIIIPLALLGIVFGIIGAIVSLAGRRSSIGMPVAGCVVCVVALIVAILSTGRAAAAIDEAIKESEAMKNATNQEKTSSTPGGEDSSTEIPVAGKPPTEKWAPVSAAVKQGGAEVRILEVSLGQVAIKESFSGDTGQSKDELLAVKIEIKNLTTTKKLEYRSWAGADFSIGRDYATLEDTFDNVYKRITFGMDKPVGRLSAVSVYPGKSVTDILVFEKPLNTVKALRLELPAKNVGGTGMFRFEIPAETIKRK